MRRENAFNRTLISVCMYVCAYVSVPYILPECSTNVHKKSYVVRSLYGFIYIWFFIIPLYMLRFVLLWFFCLFVLLLIAVSCHCSVCVRLSH